MLRVAVTGLPKVVAPPAADALIIVYGAAGARSQRQAAHTSHPWDLARSIAIQQIIQSELTILVITKTLDGSIIDDGAGVQTT